MANTLIAKIASASLKVGALETDKRNVQQGYDYISADKILGRAGDALAKAGVVIVPAILEEQTVQCDYTDNYGKAKSRFDSTVCFNMLVSDGAGDLTIAWVGRGSDYAVPDKALYKAITSGHKYFLMKLLNIGVGNEDGEHENGEESQAAPQQQTAAPPKQQLTPTATRLPETANQLGLAGTPPHNSDDGPSKFEQSIIEKWRGPVDAQIWAKTAGACANDFEARNSWINTVKEMGGYPGKDKQLVFLAFLRKHTERMAQAA